MSMSELRAELLADVAAHVESTLRELGIDAARAEHCGCAVADMLSEHWGGQVLSMPVDHAYRMSIREREIVDAHKSGKTKAELVARYEISLRGLNMLLRRAHRRHAVDAQIDLFSGALSAATPPAATQPRRQG